MLALGLTLTIANIQGIIQAIRRSNASKRLPRDWKDGQLVGVCGRIQALRDSVKAPFSGKDAVLVEYDIKYVVRTNKNSSHSVNDISGWLMTPCNVSTQRGQVRLLGFPLLSNMISSQPASGESYKKAAEFIASTEFKEMPGNPISAIREFVKVLKDDDGDVIVNYKKPGALDSKDPEEILKELEVGSYILEEKVVPQGAEVTVFGTYNKLKQALDIGSGFSNLDHTLELDKIENVVRRNYTHSILGSLFFGGITAAGHYYVAYSLGLL